jgi:hypothetical protein
LIAAILLLVYDVIRNRQLLKQNLLSTVALSAAFFVAFLVMRLTLFRGMGNTYAIDTHNQVSLSALTALS